jgi:hypothetical protein
MNIFCKKVLETKRKLKDHIFDKHKSYECSYCFINITGKTQYRSHRNKCKEVNLP